MPITLQATGGGSITLATPTTANNYTLTLAATNGTLGPAFTSGTSMLFVQSAAPTGWTKSTANNNVAIRVVSGTVSSGGSVPFTTAFASQTPAGSVSVSVNAGTLAVGVGTLGVSGSAGSTTLDTTQIPIDPNDEQVQFGRYGGTSGLANGPIGDDDNGSGGRGSYTSSTGGGGSHTHSISGSPSLSGSPSVSSASFSGTAINLGVQYIDVIVATQD